jgi:hypothetical protein
MRCKNSKISVSNFVLFFNFSMISHWWKNALFSLSMYIIVQRRAPPPPPQGPGPRIEPETFPGQGSSVFTYRRHIPHTVEGLFCKRPIQCLASSKILIPPRPLTTRRVCTPRLWCGGRTHAGWRGGGGQYFGRRQTLLCTLHT